MTSKKFIWLSLVLTTQFSLWAEDMVVEAVPSEEVGALAPIISPEEVENPVGSVQNSEVEEPMVLVDAAESLPSDSVIDAAVNSVPEESLPELILETDPSQSEELMPTEISLSDEAMLIYELMVQNGVLAQDLEKTQKELEDLQEILRRIRFDIKNHNEEERAGCKRDIMISGVGGGAVGMILGLVTMYWLKK